MLQLLSRRRPKRLQRLQKKKKGTRDLKSGYYRLAWRLPQLEVLHQATYALAKGYFNEIRDERVGKAAPDGRSTMALAEDYKRTGMEFFDRKYGKGASVSLSRPLPWPTVDQIALSAADERTAYALENLTSNPAQREIDGTPFFQLGLTGNLFFSVEPAGDAVRVTPLFLEAWLYKKVVRIPLDGTSYTMTCKTSGLFGKSFKCE